MDTDLHHAPATNGAHRAVQRSHEVNPSMASMTAPRREKPPIAFGVVPNDEWLRVNGRCDRVPIDVGQLKRRAHHDAPSQHTDPKRRGLPDLHSSSSITHYTSHITQPYDSFVVGLSHTRTPHRGGPPPP